MQTQLGISSYSYPWAIHRSQTKPTDLIKQALHWNIRRIQICDNLVLNEEQWNETITEAKRSGIELEIGSSLLNLEHTRNCIQLAHKAGSAFLRMVIDKGAYQPTEQEVVAVISALLPDLEKSGVILALENHDRFSALSLERIILATSDTWVAICLDTANSIGAGEGFKEVLRVLGRYTINLHIKDFNIRRVDSKMGFIVSGATAGKGMLDIPSILKELSQYNKCRTATLELWSEFQDSWEATLVHEENRVTESLQYLKKLFTNENGIEINQFNILT